MSSRRSETSVSTGALADPKLARGQHAWTVPGNITRSLAPLASHVSGGLAIRQLRPRDTAPERQGDPATSHLNRFGRSRLSSLADSGLITTSRSRPQRSESAFARRFRLPAAYHGGPIDDYGSMTIESSTASCSAMSSSEAFAVASVAITTRVPSTSKIQKSSVSPGATYP
jgi:hypothetical protein